MVVESSSAASSSVVYNSPSGAYGTFACAATDGLSDPEVDTFPDIYSKTAASAPMGNSGVSLIGQHFKLYTVIGGVVTLDAHTLTASATPTYPKYNPWYWRASAGVGPYTATIHPQPYGWYDAGCNSSVALNDPDIAPGGYANFSAYTLTFRYKWHSTSGNLTDLKPIKIYEDVDYSGNPGTFGADSTGPYYRPTSPPIAPDPRYGTQPFELGNPEISFDDSTIGATFDGHSCWPTQPGPNLPNYSALPVTAPQKYEYDDPATGQFGKLLFDPGSIQEGVSLNPTVFYIKKSGAHVEKPLH